jgi:nicotinamidase-related amidase
MALVEHRELPVPPHFDSGSVARVWRVPYEERAAGAERWARLQGLRPASGDSFRLCLVVVDVQNTFCIPGFELFVAGRSGTGAVDDSRRLCEFLYRNLEAVTQIVPTMDTHQAMQLFHAVYLVNESGEHPPPFTLVSVEDVEGGVWRFNPAVSSALGIDAAEGQRRLAHYVAQLRAGGKYDLTVWPYHAMLGGIGHALVSSVEEAVFFHAMARNTQYEIEIKGDKPFTENYSAIGPEVLTGPMGEALGAHNTKFIERLQQVDRLIVAGQAKSHCVAWTVQDLLTDIQAVDPALAKKVYLLEDCSSPVVVPGVVDHTAAADAAYARFAEAGMNIVKSVDNFLT